MKVLRKILPLLIMLVLLPILSLTAYAYSDIDGSHWANEMITQMQQSGVLTEITDDSGNFYPNAAITRGDFITLIIKTCAADANGDLSGMEDLALVSEEIKPYLGAAQNLGIFKGTIKDGKVYAEADSKILRQDAATILGRLLKLSSTEANGFTDQADVSVYAKTYVTALTAKSIIKGYSDNSFKPKAHITRAEAVSLAKYAKTYCDLNKNQLTTLCGLGSVNALDGTLAKAAFGQPQGLTADKAGNIYIFDTDNSLVRKISGEKVSTVAGLAKYRDAYGDVIGSYVDGHISAAYLHKPTDGVILTNGDLLFADQAANAIRCISGSAVYTYSGDEMPGYAEGAAEKARYNSPSSVAVDDKGNLYVADTLNHCIRVIDKNRNSSLLAGTPQKSGFADGNAKETLFNEPTGIAVSADGSTVFVSDSGNQRIRMIKDGKVITYAGSGAEKDSVSGYIIGGYYDGAAAKAQFLFPRGLYLTANGLLLVADRGNNVIRAITTDGKVMTIAGNGDADCISGAALSASLNGPTDISLIGDKLYITDTNNNAIRILTFNPDMLK